ncbi:MAG TPA: WbuC family cupin fold metalloprotein [Nitrospinaceae bacterium]|jgi:cupin fold WbuC family metalloprotein|nr:WbuC family cupin fold metalloprotein [Nitrospinaceae bacterium]|tara:strand:- start:3976 stop:4509 length:534 start_codon:yes stop_codon:yes gene_type:complete
MLNYEKINDEVLYTKDVITRIDASDIEILKSMAATNPRKRVRLCAHSGPDDLVHEMLIVLGAASYIPPHKESAKSESFHMIEGSINVLVYNDDGTLRDVIPLAAPGSDRPFYYRLPEGLFHTVLPESDVVVFHETTNGPFQAGVAQFADWAPGNEDDAQEKENYLEAMRRMVRSTGA